MVVFESTLRYAAISDLSLIIYLTIPWVLFFIAYANFFIKVKNVKIYQKYIIFNFLNKLLIVTLIFFSLTIILNIFEEISFFKDTESNFLLPYFLTFLTAPITLFEIFSFHIFNFNSVFFLRYF